MLDDILLKVEQNLNKLHISKAKKYGLAFSGGPDSMFLAYALFKLDYTNIYLIYVNYHDSNLVDIEESIVKDASKNFNFKLIKADYYMPKKGNFEDIARRFRYQYFSSIQNEYNLDGILIAHQLDDLLCTYLMQVNSNRIVTYYGLKQENYINNSHIYRPMLNIYKKDLIEYLNLNNIQFYDDFTNNNLNRTRNYTRINILSNLDHTKLLNEINAKNDELSKLISISNSNKIYYKDYLNLDINSKLFCIYNYLNTNFPNLNYTKLISLRNLIFEALKKKDTSKIELSKELSLYKDYSFFYVTETVIQTNYLYSNLENKAYDFKQIYIDIKTLNLNPSYFPIKLTTCLKDYTFSTNIINNSVSNFIKSNKVPSYLRSIYPVILNSKDEVVYVPFYKDILEKKIDIKFKGYIIS